MYISIIIIFQYCQNPSCKIKWAVACGVCISTDRRHRMESGSGVLNSAPKASMPSKYQITFTLFPYVIVIMLIFPCPS